VTAALVLREPEPPHYDDAGAGDVPLALARLLGARLAASLLQVFGSVRDAARASDAELRALGLTDRKLGAFRDAVAVGTLAQAAPVLGTQILGPDDVARYMSAKLGLCDVEEFYVVALDARRRVIGEILLARGSVDAVGIEPRQVFRALVRADATAAIVVHNHPSTDPTPSAIDEAITRKLREGGALVGIEILDHIVVAAGGQWVQIK
jgi:DNA repair protein RadC